MKDVVELIARIPSKKVGHWEEGFLGKMLCIEGMSSKYSQFSLPDCGSSEIHFEALHDVYTSKSQWERMDLATRANPQKIAWQFINSVERLGIELMELCDVAQKTGKQKDIAAAFECLRKFSIPLYAYHFITTGIEEYFVESLPEKYRSRLGEIIVPEPDININLEKRDLLGIKISGVTDEKLKEHAAKWGWMGFCLYDGRFLDVADYRKEIEHVELPPVQKPLIVNGCEDLCLMMRKMAYTKFSRIDNVNIALFKLDVAMKSIVREMGFDENLLFAFHPREITGEMNPPTLKELRNRADGSLIVLHRDVVSWFDRETAARALQRITVAEKTTKVQGRGVFSGIVRGRAVIVKGTKDCSKVQKGDIMICNETGTPFEPYMDKAAAVVSEIGGLLSHVAIFARERKKPSVVSCTGCTDIFKDDEMVEVDANTGLVRKID